MTCAPASQSVLTTAAPTPLVPPVTSARLLASCRSKLMRDLQERDLPALESEDEPQIDRAAREITGEPARDDVPALLLLHGEGFAGVRVFGRCLGLPRLDGRGTTMGLSLVLHNGPRREAACNGF